MIMKKQKPTHTPKLSVFSYHTQADKSQDKENETKVSKQKEKEEMSLDGC